MKSAFSTLEKLVRWKLAKQRNITEATEGRRRQYVIFLGIFVEVMTKRETWTRAVEYVRREDISNNATARITKAAIDKEHHPMIAAKGAVSAAWLGSIPKSTSYVRHL
jgi:hypothetical protein